MQQGRGHIRPLTGLRYVAALLVVLTHLLRLQGSGPIHTALILAGPAAMTLFFCLSGFVITTNYYDLFTHWTRRAFGFYAGARFARIYPLFFVLLVLDVSLRGIGGHWRELLEHVFLVQAWENDLGRMAAFFPVSWSLSVELFLYACFPIIALLLFRLRLDRPERLWGVLAFAIAGSFVVALAFHLAGRDELSPSDPNGVMRWLQYNPAPRLLDFLAGCAIARLNVRPHLGPTRAWTGVAYASGALFLLALFGSPFVNSYPDGPRIESFGYDFAYLLPLSLMMLALARSPHSLLARSLSTPTMLLLGAASYALYLCHQFVIQGILTENATGVLPPIALGTPTGIVRAVMIVGLVTVLSIGLYRTIEEPMRRILRARFDAATGGSGVVVRRPPSDPVIDRGPAPAPEVGSKV